MPSRPAPRPRKSDSTVVELPVTPKAVRSAVAGNRSTEGTARNQKQAPTSATATSAKTAKKTTSKKPALSKPAVSTPNEAVATAVAVERGKETTATSASVMKRPDDRPNASASATAEPAKKSTPRRKSVTSTPVTSTRTSAKDAPSDPQVSHEERLQYIAEAAYYIAERRGFAPGYEHQNWVEAEAEVNERLQASGAMPQKNNQTEA